MVTASLAISYNPTIKVNFSAFRSGFDAKQAGIVIQKTHDEFDTCHTSPSIDLATRDDKTFIYANEPWVNSFGVETTKSIQVGYIQGELPEGMALNVISGKDGRVVQLAVEDSTLEALQPLEGKSFLVPEGGQLCLNYHNKPLTIKLNATNRTVLFSKADYEQLGQYCSKSEPKLYKRDKEDETDPAFISLLSVGGAGSRLFPLSSATACDATLPDGTTRPALPAHAKPAGWLPGENKTMVGRALYYLTLAGVKKVYTPTVNINAPETVKAAINVAEKDIKKKTGVKLNVKQIDEDRLAGQSSYVPTLWEDKLKAKYEAGKRIPYVISDFPDATYFPYPPYQEMMDEVRTELKAEQAESKNKPFDGWVLAKTIDKKNLGELVNKYGETTWIKHDDNHPENDGLLIGMHEKPKSVKDAKKFAEADLTSYNERYDSNLNEDDEIIGYRLGTEIYGPELLKAACTNQADEYPLIADRNKEGKIILAKGKPIYSMYNVFQAVGKGEVVKEEEKTTPVKVKVIPLPTNYKWMDMGNIHGYLDTVRQLYYCLTGKYLRFEERHVPYVIGGQLQPTGEATEEVTLYGQDVIKTIKETLNMKTIGAVMLVDLNHPDRLNEPEATGLFRSICNFFRGFFDGSESS